MRWAFDGGRFWSAPAERSDDGALAGTHSSGCHVMPRSGTPTATNEQSQSGVALRLPPHSKRALIITTLLFCVWIAITASAQTADKVPRPEEKAKADRVVAKQQDQSAQHSSSIEFRGQQAFDENR